MPEKAESFPLRRGLDPRNSPNSQADLLERISSLQSSIAHGQQSLGFQAQNLTQVPFNMSSMQARTSSPSERRAKLVSIIDSALSLVDIEDFADSEVQGCGEEGTRQ